MEGRQNEGKNDKSYWRDRTRKKGQLSSKRKTYAKRTVGHKEVDNKGITSEQKNEKTCRRDDKWKKNNQRKEDKETTQTTKKYMNSEGRTLIGMKEKKKGKRGHKKERNIRHAVGKKKNRIKKLE